VSAFAYARDVVGGRWKKGEAVVLASPFRDEYLALAREEGASGLLARLIGRMRGR
jgi:hypothetical protein